MRRASIYCSTMERQHGISEHDKPSENAKIIDAMENENTISCIFSFL